jgi:CheY-like chemotaxis protein
VDRKLIRLLLIEDNPADALMLREALADDKWASYAITVAERLGAGLAELARQPFDVALVDLGLPDSQGPATLQGLQRYAPDLPIVVLSGLEDEEVARSRPCRPARRTTCSRGRPVGAPGLPGGAARQPGKIPGPL